MYQDPQIKIIKILLILTVIFGVFLFILRLNYVDYRVSSPFTQKSNIFALLGNNTDTRRVIYGYLPWWSLEQLEYIQLDKVTDIAYFGVYLNDDGNFKKSVDGIFEPGYNKWVADPKLKEFVERAKKYHVRVALTLIAHEDDVTDKFLDCGDCWETVANNLKAEMDKHEVKDLNLNFEYGGTTEKRYADKYVEFVDFINKKMDHYYEDSFVVTSAFADSTETDRVSSNLEGLGSVADGIFIMGYDYHRPQSDNAGPVAPIPALTEDLESFLQQVPPNKLILGVPYYGYNWVVESYEEGAKRLEGNDDIGFSKSQMYANVMDMILEIHPQTYWNDSSKTPYFTYISEETGSKRQAHYENSESLKEKYNLIKNKDLMGVGIWALGYDGGYTELWDLLEEEFWN